MRKLRVLNTSNSLANEFSRCCQQYKTLSIAVAWCGDPEKTLPYKYLENFNGNIKAIIGVAFHNTHPDAFKWFSDISANIRVFKDDQKLFHPKVYLFKDEDRYALFIGSSNLTYNGFYENIETNCLIEDTTSAKMEKDITLLEKTLAKWHTADFSFKPTKQWLEGYRQRYKTIANKLRKLKITTPARVDEEIPTASWLEHATWDVYYSKVLEGLKRNGRQGQGYHQVLDAASQKVPVPWKTRHFKDIENRRIIGGMEPYGWLGHVAASGQFRSLLAKGTPRQHSTIVKAINAIARFNQPIPWLQLKSHLDHLISLGPTMKVWGRLLCIVRPDLYCTVASVSVRKNLSQMLSVPQNRFNGSEGYIELIKQIHSSPWFNSNAPNNKKENEVWKRRAAFLDAIFY